MLCGPMCVWRSKVCGGLATYQCVKPGRFVAVCVWRCNVCGAPATCQSVKRKHVCVGLNVKRNAHVIMLKPECEVIKAAEVKLRSEGRLHVTSQCVGLGAAKGMSARR